MAIKRWSLGCLAALMTLGQCGLATAAVPPITADGLVLVVNKNQPAGRELAEHYASVRGVPDGRIIEVDVPDVTEINAEIFDRAIARVVRQEIERRDLRERTQCIVLFYGLPLRVKEPERTPAELTELREVIEPTISVLTAQFRQSVQAMEAVARDADPAFKPAAGESVDALRQRGLAAERATEAAIGRQTTPETQQRLRAAQADARKSLLAMPGLSGYPADRPANLPSQAEMNDLLARSSDPDARRRVREALYVAGNVFQLLMVCEIQKRSMIVGEGEASVDSELSCLWAGAYSRARWLENPWHYRTSNEGGRAQFVRVARIDGPTPQIARRVIDNSVAVEKEGLLGDVVLDARGMAGANPSPGSYLACDQAIRNVARYTGGVEGIRTVFDNNDALLPPNSSGEAAVYCGWYSVRKYQPTARYRPGSIAWHVASYEMVTLRSPNESGWCRHLMLDGADVTIGPVGEPYLIAFPPADEFFGLVFTGRASVAEAYWATVPVTSWKMILIGDPLYRPFAKRPLIGPDRLPEALRRALPES